MNVDQDIQFCKIRHLYICFYWICLLKSIKYSKNINTYETEWIKEKEKIYYARPDILEILFWNN
jgi:hypothetical protein